MFHTCTLHSDGRPLQTQVSFCESGLLYFPKAHVYLKNPTVWFLCYNCYLRLRLSILFHQSKLSERLDLVQTVPRLSRGVTTRVCQFMPTSRMRHYSCTVQYATLEEAGPGSDSVCDVLCVCLVFGSAQLPLRAPRIMKETDIYCYHPTFT